GNSAYRGLEGGTSLYQEVLRRECRTQAVGGVSDVARLLSKHALKEWRHASDGEDYIQVFRGDARVTEKECQTGRSSGVALLELLE
ncbi:hypothetical protein TRAPUB_3988, partial [Trametes pubescens]